jgi:hypothetical protein
MKVALYYIKLFIVYLLCFICGMIVFAAWYSGSHGHLMFRVNFIEDWIAATLLFLFWVLPFCFLIRTIKKIIF